MGKYVRLPIIVVIVLVGLFVLCGIAFNQVFRYISYSFYKKTEQYTEVDDTVKKLEIGEEKDLIGYVRSTDYTEAKKTIIFFGGSKEIAYNAVLDYGKVFNEYAFVCVDYPGSQESQGSMNLGTMQKAALRLYDYIVDLNYIDKDNIYVIGNSYGTGIATYLASKRDCNKLVLITPYRDVYDLYNAIIPIFNSPFGWFITDNINTKEYAKSVTEQTLIITSDSDGGTLDSSISYSLADYFSDASVTEFKGIEHAGYLKNEKVVLAIKNFCE
jgi:uncharacterized protein